MRSTRSGPLGLSRSPRNHCCHPPPSSIAFVPSPPPSLSLVLRRHVGLNRQGLWNRCGGSLSGLLVQDHPNWQPSFALLPLIPVSFTSKEHPVVARLAPFHIAPLQPVRSLLLAVVPSPPPACHLGLGLPRQSLPLRLSRRDLRSECGGSFFSLGYCLWSSTVRPIARPLLRSQHLLVSSSLTLVRHRLWRTPSSSRAPIQPLMAICKSLVPLWVCHPGSTYRSFLALTGYFRTQLVRVRPL